MRLIHPALLKQKATNAGINSGVNEVLVKVVKDVRAALPKYESEGAAGMDLCAFLDADVSIPPLGRVKIPTGLKIEIPQGYEGQIRPRSGLAVKKGLTVLNSPGTIDSDYRGNLDIILINLGGDDIIIKDGERIAQLVIAPVCKANLVEVGDLGATARGGGGFGSTGA
jgi:dUTP pyrophosphatase